METADVTIIGGGIVGLSIAFHLAKTGAGKVILCEARSVGSGTSAMSGAMCGQQAEITDAISQLAVRALDTYEHFDERVGGDCGFFNHGILGLTSDLEMAHRSTAAARKNGSVANAITDREARELFPELATEGYGAAVLYPRSGCVDSYRTMQSYASAARHLGVDIREFTPVTRIETQGPRVHAIHTSDGSIAPGKVVLACGPWSQKVANTAGLRLPIEPTLVGVSFYRQPPDFHERPPVLSVELSIIPWHNKHFRVLCDRRNPLIHIEPDPTDAVCPQWMVEETSAVIYRQLPNMRHGRFQGAYQTCYDDTPDLMPLLGFVPGIDNLFLDCGWSGRGFKFSVALGEYVARWILTGSLELDLAPWLASRYQLHAQ